MYLLALSDVKDSLFCYMRSSFKAIQNELNSHAHVIDKLVQNGIELARTCPLHADVTKIAFEKLKDRFGLLQKTSHARKDVLQQNCNAFQVDNSGFSMIEVKCLSHRFSNSPCLAIGPYQLSIWESLL